MALIDVLEELQACLCEALEATPGGPPCFCCIIHAPTPPPAREGPLADLCKCGLAWVRLVDLAPRVAPRSQKRLANGIVCSPALVSVATVELGVLRCAGIKDGMKASEVCICLGQHAEIAAADAEALIRAAVCCPSGGTFERVAPAGSPTGDGECAGSVLRVVVEIPRDTGSPGENP